MRKFLIILVGVSLVSWPFIAILVYAALNGRLGLLVLPAVSFLAVGSLFVGTFLIALGGFSDRE